MSPILVRPVREQLEHDRIIRLMPGRYRRKFEVGINPGAEQNAAIGNGPAALYPDAVLFSTERSRKVLGVVEVETGESINHLEALAQWAHFARLKVPFHLYVPMATVDVVRRLSSDHQIAVTEIWSYDNVGDQVRFTLVQKAPEPKSAGGVRAAAPRPAPSRPAATRVQKTAAKAPARTAAPRRKAAPARPARAAAAPRPAAKSVAKRAKAAPVRKAASGKTSAKRR